MSVRPTIIVSDARIDASSLLRSTDDSELRDALKNVFLGHIPHPLGELSLTRDDLIKALGGLARYFALPDKVRFRRKGEILAGNEIKDELRRRCIERAVDIPEDELEINLSRIPGHLVLPGELQSWKLDEISTGKLGMLLFSLSVTTAGGSVRQILQVDVSRNIEAAKIVRILKRGAILTSADLAVEKIRIKSDHAQVPVSFKEAVGKELRCYKSAGTVLRPADIIAGCSNAKADNNHIGRSMKAQSDNWVVNPGDKVNFTFESGGLSLSVAAKAVQGGEIGDRIKLVNLQNNRSVAGVIISEERVEHVNH